MVSLEVRFVDDGLCLWSLMSPMVPIVWWSVPQYKGERPVGSLKECDLGVGLVGL